MEFEPEFTRLMGFAPMHWQIRLYQEYLARENLPASLDIPTGLGKTAVMAIWYLASKAGASLPRRLVYVVDRRAVVDQATTVANDIKDRSGDDDLRISTLRGAHADNRDWLKDPGATAIIVGTVDMIGSRLLFSGYGVSRRTCSYHAGLLGADSLVVLDESHLVPPFERLLESIEGGASTYGPRTNESRDIVPALHLMSLSATGGKREGESFELDKGDMDDPIVDRRLNARKHLIIVPCNGTNFETALAEQAWKLSGEGQQRVRVLVYCTSREIAEKTAQSIGKLAKAAKTAVNLVLFTGGRRVRERQAAADHLAALGFLGSANVTLDKPAFVIATAAGEVGVDMDADHMACDLVEWERMVQRFGRVNRKGDGDAQVVLLTDPPVPAKKEAEARETQRCLLAPFAALPHPDSGIDVSPGALLKLKQQAHSDADLQRTIDAASTSPPLYPALSRALIDAWSMTSLEKHTGRPDIQPWLRGWVDDIPQTEVVWRSYLPVRVHGEIATKKEIEGFFQAAPPHLSEKLETESWRVSEWLVGRANALLKKDPDVANAIVAFALNPDGSLRQSIHLRDLVPLDDKKREKARKERLTGEILPGAVLVVDRRVGGLSADGLLSPNAGDTSLRTADDGEDWGPDVGFRIHVEANSDKDQYLRVTFAFATRQSDAEGEGTEYLLVETSKTENSRAASPNPQLLDEHQSWTEDRARTIAHAVGLTGNHAEALAIAARLHDEGKRAARWQRAFNAKSDGAYAKTSGPLVMARLGGYRHEFGSLPYAEKSARLQGIPQDLQSLVLHLIAAHHGRARPVIDTEGCEDAPPSVLQSRARDVALRYASLQKQWGPWGLAWWEALLRAADQQASRDNDERGNGHG